MRHSDYIFNITKEEYEETKNLNKQLLAENAELKIQVSHLQHEIAKLKEAKFDVN